MSTTHPVSQTRTPVLESGDRLTRTEFERCYDGSISAKDPWVSNL